MNTRLFTFGCSFTKYKWKTWADLIGSNYQEYFNFGHPGAGNYYIALKLYETHLKYNLNKNDTAIIMLSSANRMDVWNDKLNSFNLSGNIYASERIFGKKFIRDVWNDTHSIYNSWFCARSIKNMLDLIGCKFKIVEAFGLLNTDAGYEIKINDEIKPAIEDYKKIVYTTENLNTYSSKFNPQSYKNPDGTLDGHPTIMCNYNFIKEHMSEFYNTKMDSLAVDWDAEYHQKLYTNDRLI